MWFAIKIAAVSLPRILSMQLCGPTVSSLLASPTPGRRKVHSWHCQPQRPPLPEHHSAASPPLFPALIYTAKQAAIDPECNAGLSLLSSHNTTGRQRPPEGSGARGHISTIAQTPKLTNTGTHKPRTLHLFSGTVEL